MPSKPTAQLPQPVPDTVAGLFFPVHGINDSVSLSDMPDGFTPVGENVRVYEALTGRGRGGSRPGITKFIPEQHSGTNEIQHITYIVTVDAMNLGWSFEGNDQGFPGIYGGIGFYALIPLSHLGFPGDGGGGYPPAIIDSRLLVMGARDLETGVITMSYTTMRTVEWPAGPDTIMVRITNQDGQSGDFIGFEQVTFHTSPSGAPGDNNSLFTQFALVDPPAGTHGLAELEVQSDLPREVIYFGTNSAVGGRTFTSPYGIKIRFTPYKLTITTSAGSAPADGTPVTVTGTLRDYLGNLIAAKIIRMNTNPNGSVGDGVFATTNGSGQVQYTVSATTPGIVSYGMTEQSESVNQLNRQDVNYGPSGDSKFRQSAWDIDGSTAEAPFTISATLPFPVLEGSLLVLAFERTKDYNDPGAEPVPTWTIADNSGRTYVLAAEKLTDNIVLNPNLHRDVYLALYYVANAVAGGCTVTVTLTGFSYARLAIHEYTGVLAASPLHATSTNSGNSLGTLSLTASTGSVTINSVGDLVFAVYGLTGNTIDTSAVSALFTARQQRINNAGDYGVGDPPNTMVIETDDISAASGTSGASWSLMQTEQISQNNVWWNAIAATFKKA